jgi:hypothetical protein
VIERLKRSIQSRIVIENCSRTINVSRRAEFLRDAGKVDILTVEMPVAITKRMHVAAAFVSNAEART